MTTLGAVCVDCLTWRVIPVWTMAGLAYHCPCGACWITRWGSAL